MLKLFMALFANPHQADVMAPLPKFNDAETVAKREALKERRIAWNKEHRRSPYHILNGGGFYKRDQR